MFLLQQPRGEENLIRMQTGPLGSTYSTLKLPSTSNAPQIILPSEMISDRQTARRAAKLETGW